MSRPANPSYAIPVHAPDTNYPAELGPNANPWAGTATKHVHPGSASVGLTPNTGVAAQVVNKLVYDAYATDSSAKTYAGTIMDYVGQLPALNFPVAVTATLLRQAKYIPGTRKWIGWSLVDDWFVVTSDAFASWPSSTSIGGSSLRLAPCGTQPRFTSSSAPSLRRSGVRT